MTSSLRRHERARASGPQNLPVRVPDEPDLVVVDTTWGRIQPLQPFPEVPTVGELELIELVAAGARLVDTRVGDSRSGTTLPGAIHVPHDEIVDRRSELDASITNILFCNGPQCPQTPDGITSLLAAGHPAGSLAYYRGGLHDWVTLGYPTEDI